MSQKGIQGFLSIQAQFSQMGAGGKILEILPIGPLGQETHKFLWYKRYLENWFCSDVAQEMVMQIKFYFWRPIEAFKKEKFFHKCADLIFPLNT